MHPSELKLGDIICFDTFNGTPAHVGMFTASIGDKYYVTHSVINETPGLQTTMLKDTVRMHVFRPVNAELGARAAQRILAWAAYRIPYDVRRRDVMIKIRDKMVSHAVRLDKNEAIDYILEYHKHEATTKFYERIKFAARRDTCPVKMLDGMEGRGFTCVQAVILAYQVEELAPYVKTLAQVQVELASLSTTVEQITEAWISDKHCPTEILEKYALPSSYEAYAESLKSKEEFTDFMLKNKNAPTINHPHYHPSLVAWNFDLNPSIDNFIQNFDSCLNLQAKLCFTDGLYGFMQQNTKHWQDMGKLDSSCLQSTFNEEEKTIHKRKKSCSDNEIDLNQRQVSLERKLSSPRLRVSPDLGLESKSTSPRQSLGSRATSPLAFSSLSIHSASSSPQSESSENLYSPMSFGASSRVTVQGNEEENIFSGMFSPMIERRFAKKLSLS